MMTKMAQRHRRTNEVTDRTRNPEDVKVVSPQELAIMAPHIFKYEKV